MKKFAWPPWPKFPEIPPMPDMPEFPEWFSAPAVGCICPPGANRECERPDCPRKNPAKAPQT